MVSAACKARDDLQNSQTHGTANEELFLLLVCLFRVNTILIASVGASDEAGGVPLVGFAWYSLDGCSAKS